MVKSRPYHIKPWEEATEKDLLEGCEQGNPAALFCRGRDMVENPLPNNVDNPEIAFREGMDFLRRAYDAKSPGKLSMLDKRAFHAARDNAKACLIDILLKSTYQLYSHYKPSADEKFSNLKEAAELEDSRAKFWLGEEYLKSGDPENKEVALSLIVGAFEQKEKFYVEDISGLIDEQTFLAVKAEALFTHAIKNASRLDQADIMQAQECIEELCDAEKYGEAGFEKARSTLSRVQDRLGAEHLASIPNVRSDDPLLEEFSSAKKKGTNLGLTEVRDALRKSYDTVDAYGAALGIDMGAQNEVLGR